MRPRLLSLPRPSPAFFAGAIFVALMLLHAGALPLSSFLERLEYANLDFFFKVRGKISPHERIVIVAIDDASFQRYGAWPWPRTRIAELVKSIAGAHPELVVCDFILHEKTEEGAGAAALAQTFEATRAADGRRRVLLPYYFSELQKDVHAVKRAAPEPIAASALILFDAPQALENLSLPRAAALFYSTNELLRSSLPGGHINVLAEGETVRREYHMIRYGESYFPSLPLQVAIHALGLTRGEVLVKAGQGIQLGKVFVPTDTLARTWINYYGEAQTFPTISATEVFESKAHARFTNKIVFLGVTAAGTQDFLRTPTSARMPGVEKLATSTANILYGETLQRNTGMLALEIFVLAALGAIVFLAGRKWPRSYSGVFLLGVALALWVAAFGLFANSDLWFKPAGLIITLGLIHAASMMGVRGAHTQANSSAATRTEEIPRRIGRYEIVREIGAGAMGKIFEGRDAMINRRVAIKTIRPLPGLSSSSNARMRQRFLHEAQAAGALNHPNIVTIYEAEEAETYSYIVMEFLEGKTFEEIIEREAPLSLQEIAALLLPVCAALAYAHERGVVHRDVKPSNLMRTREGVVKLMDFGIAHIFSSNLTQEGALLGTPNYMSPEQIRGEKVDGRSDIFSLGVVAYEMATRSRPFLGESMAAISHCILSGEIIPPSELQSRLPAAFDEVIRKALHKVKEERYNTAKEFAAALAPIE